MKNKKHWKDIMKISGIYKIINKVNGKVYYGSSNDIINRFNQHKSLLNRQKHQNIHLQRSWNKYGKDNFEFNIIELINEDELVLTEQKYLDLCKLSPSKFYNIGYDSNSATRGKIHTEETKRKISISVSKSMKGIKFSSTHIQNLKKSHKGLIHSIETKRKMSESHKGETAYQYGKKLSIEERKKLGNQSKFKFFHKEHGQKICRTIDLSIDFQLSGKGISTICRGTRKSYKGWKCLKKYE
jgi:group I intron endonuclease